MTLPETIQQLVDAWGPSGYEDQVRDLILEQVAGLVDEHYVDNLGNLICRLGTGDLKVMIAVHMDEIGLMVNYVEENGFLRFDTLGRLLLTALHGSRVKFANGLLGVIGLENSWTRRTLPKIEEFYISVEPDHNIRIGDPAVFWSQFYSQGDWLIGKSLDNRLNCAIAVEIIKQLSHTPHQLYFVFTVQEEVGLRGAGPATFGVQPDLGIALDVISGGDEPKVANVAIKPGNGPAIKVRDRYHLVPRPLLELIVRRAQEANIEYQLAARDIGGTDGAAIQGSRAGVPTASICIPTRYLHTPSEVAHSGDVLGTLNLLLTLLSHSIEW